MKPLVISFSVIITLFFSSCARKLHAVDVSDPKIESKDTTVLLPKKNKWLDSVHNQPWQWMYGKYTTNYSDGNKKFTFKTSLKCTKDSALNALISFASIPVFNALATTDSLIYVNKKDRCYGQKSIASFKELLGVELSLKNIQELFLGLPLGYNDTLNYRDSLNLAGDSCYVNGLVVGEKTIAYRYASSVNSPRLDWQEITSKEDATTARVQYLSWQRHKDMFIPSSFMIAIKSNERNINVLFTYDKFELDIPQEIYLQIPDDYAPCK